MSNIKPFITDPQQRRILEENMHGELPYTLMNDFLSKYSFQKDLYALAGLIAALLRIPVDTVTDIEILNPIEPGETVTDKSCILDIQLELNHNKIINVEIQARHQPFWPERSITYLCRCFDRLQIGEEYDLIKPCIQIGILNHDLFGVDDPRHNELFLSEYRLLNTVTHTEYCGKFEIRVLSLNHIDNADDEDKASPNGLFYWAKLFLSSSWEEMKMTAQDNPHMKSFVGTVRQLTADEKVAMACEARRRYSNDIASYEAWVRRSEEKALQAEEKLTKAEAELAQMKNIVAQLERQLATRNN